jgi:glutaminyl-peptide cyclotransferase
MPTKKIFTLTAITIISLVTLLATLLIRESRNLNREFDGNKALQHVEYQVNLGPRTLGSEAHNKVQAYILQKLEDYGWEAYKEITNINSDIEINNIIGKRGDSGLWIIIGAHFDSRFYADRDPDPNKHLTPVPGANDGASGVGVLLELANVLPKNLDKQIWLVFFDAEDNGNIPGYDWIMGSQVFASKLTAYPDAVVVIDMIGDKDLNIYQEMNSDSRLTDEIWSVASELEFHQFIPTLKYRILDDHIPFVNLGIPAVNIIDFDYPFWHTTEDTFDKVSAESLYAVGKTLLTWINK